MRKLLSCLCLSVLLFACRKSSTPDPVPPTVVTTDSLNGWQKINTGIAGSFADVAFVTPATGFLAASNGLYRSVDSGKTWAREPAITSFPVTINFLNAQYGYAVGDNYMYVTANGGASWQRKTVYPSRLVADVWFVNPSTGFAGLQGGPLLKTTDTGNTWQPVPNLINHEWYSVFFLNEQQGWCATKDSLFRTTNGGAAWTGRKVTNDYIFTVFFATPSNGWLASDSSVYRTADGGATWSKTSLGSPAFDLQFLSAQIGYASALNAVFKTTDGGMTWKKDLAATLTYFPELHFLDENTGWVIGANNTLYRWKK